MSEKTTRLQDDLTAFADARGAKLGIPGFSVGVIDKDHQWTSGFGVTSIVHPLAVTDQTLFQIGSITKTFTGILAMQLVESGELDLDAPIRSILPAFRVRNEDASRCATLRHLLTHTCGWTGDTNTDTGNGADALERFLEKVADLEQLAPLGTVWSYNNAAFGIIGRMIEVATGTPYGTALRKRLLEPLSFRTGFLEAGDVMTERFVVGHNVDATGAKVAKPWAMAKYVEPMGSLVCDIKDLLIYARFLLGDGRTEDGQRVLSAESLARMYQPAARIQGNASWGLAFSVVDRDKVRIVSHGGGTHGQTCLLSIAPKREFAVAVVTNASCGSRLAGEITHRALQTYLDIPEEHPQAIPSDESTRSELVGRYERPLCDVHIGLLGGQLVAQTIYKMGSPKREDPIPAPPSPVRLTPCAEDQLLILDGPSSGRTIDVVRHEDGSIGWLRIGLRIHRRAADPL